MPTIIWIAVKCKTETISKVKRNQWPFGRFQYNERRARRRRRDVIKRTEGWASRYTHTYRQSRARGEREISGCWLRATLATDWSAGKLPASLNLATEDFAFIVLSSQLIPIFFFALTRKRVPVKWNTFDNSLAKQSFNVGFTKLKKGTIFCSYFYF